MAGGSDAVVGKIVLRAEDLQRALAATPQVRKLKICGVLAAFLGVAVVGVTFWFDHAVDASKAAVGPVLVAVSLVSWLSPKLGAWRQFRAMNDGQKTQIYRLDSRGYSVESAHSSSLTHWGDVRKYVEGPESFLLYTNPYVGALIAKRAFAPADIDRVRDLLRRHVTPRGTKGG